MHVCMCLCICHEWMGIKGGWKVWDPLDLKLKAAVSHQIWVLGTEFWSSRRAVSALNCEPSLQSLGKHLERLNTDEPESTCTRGCKRDIRTNSL